MATITINITDALAIIISGVALIINMKTMRTIRKLDKIAKASGLKRYTR